MEKQSFIRIYHKLKAVSSFETAISNAEVSNAETTVSAFETSISNAFETAVSAFETIISASEEAVSHLRAKGGLATGGFERILNFFAKNSKFFSVLVGGRCVPDPCFLAEGGKTLPDLQWRTHPVHKYSAQLDVSCHR